MLYVTRTQKLIFAFVVLVLVIISGTIYIRQDKTTEISIVETVPDQVETPVEIIAAEIIPEEISVYICGFVMNPGVVKVIEGTRLDEVIKLAGGAKEEADLEIVNLAYKLADEDMVYIPKKGEKPQAEGKTIQGVNTVKGAAVNKSGKININTASEKELDTLEGVGPVTAKAIIQFREQKGAFMTIEDIKKVSGIGEAKFNGMKDKITVE